MATKELANSIAHKMPNDLKKAILASPDAIAAWESITPLARNEWICWTVSVKTDVTRQDHIKRTVTELAEGKRRPCCWIGCVHRKDKKMSASQKFILSKQAR